MALGNVGQNNGNKSYDPSYYSRFKIKNPNDKLELNFTFWRGTLKIAVVETGDPNEGRNNELAYIHLSPIKARMFANCVDRIIKDPDSIDTFGIDTGFGETRGLLAISRDMGKPFLFIAKVDKNGAYESSQRFNFNYDYNYSLNISNLDKLACAKDYNNEVELYMFRDLLLDYARHSSGVVGASVYDIGRYETNKINSLIKKMADSMGVESGSGYNRNSGGSNSSYFDNNVSSASNKKSNTSYQSIDDLEEELG